MRDCRIEGNPAASRGSSGLYCGDGSSPTLAGCTIARHRNRAVYAYESSPRLLRCSIEGNASLGLDGWGESVRPVLEDCAIRGNGGAGMFLSGNASPILRRCMISGNLGNGVAMTASSGGLFEDCVIVRNGDGIQCDGGASPTFRSCTIAFNGGCGTWTDDGAAPVFESCTIAWNQSWGAGIYANDHPTFRSCIVWGNIGGSFYLGGMATATVERSCVEGGSPVPGEGNISVDPLFCGWGRLAEAYVDASSPGPGDGSEERPFPSLAPALEFGLSLAEGSPLIGAGLGSAAMGDDLGTCAEPGGAVRTIRVASGEYSLEGSSLAARASLVGAGEDRTVIRGGIRGLRTGATLARLTSTWGTAGVTVTGNESPRIEHVTARANRYGGFDIRNASPTLESCTAAGNYLYGFCCTYSSAVLTNCASWGNATDIDGGGFCSIGTSAAPTLVNCTVTGNLATRWGTAGIVCTQGGTVTARNTIVWANTPQAASGVDSTCLTVEDPLFVAPGVYDFARRVTVEVDGLLLEVPDFIVEEPNLRLRPGSPAIDLADCALGPDRDIAGVPRPQGAGCDAGAHEAVLDVTFIRGDPNGDGEVDLSDTVFILLRLFAGEEAPSCPKAADLNDDGGIDISDPIAGLQYLFLGKLPIPAPCPTCGTDGTEDELDCPDHPACR